jgi:stage II sporulation protein AA (anti-sigma F factor antagonist)
LFFTTENDKKIGGPVCIIYADRLFLFGGVFVPVEIDIDENCVTAYISGEIDHHNAAGLRSKIDEAVEISYPEVLVLDFGGVTFMDSSGIGLVMGRYKLMKNLSGKVFIENAPRQIKKVLRMAGIEKMLSEKSGKEVLV